MPAKLWNPRDSRMASPVSNSKAKFRIALLSVIVASLAAAVSAAPAGPSRVNPRDGLTYQWIPPGSYVTGCLPGDTQCYGLERRREKVVVAAGFWIGRTEVTQTAYMRVMHADPSYYNGADLPADFLNSSWALSSLQA